MKIAVLGCGPAGLLAAYAADQSEAVQVLDIFSQKVRSHIEGAQYIHEPIAGITDGDPVIISYTKLGESMGYAKKVYGSPEAPSSWKLFDTGDHPAWPMAATYHKLWMKYIDEIQNMQILPSDLGVLNKKYDLIFSAVPRRGLCTKQHSFRNQRVYFMQKAVFEMDNVVIYSGRDEDAWYRSSNLFGHGSTEFSRFAFGDAEWTDTPKNIRHHRLRPGIKPIDHDCTCLEVYDKIIPVGRFGKWQKGVLVTDAYEDAKRTIAEMAHALY